MTAELIEVGEEIQNEFGLRKIHGGAFFVPPRDYRDAWVVVLVRQNADRRRAEEKMTGIFHRGIEPPSGEYAAQVTVGKKCDLAFPLPQLRQQPVDAGGDIPR